MMKASLGSAGMTGCLINFKYVMFSQPNSWMENTVSAVYVADPLTSCCLFWYLPAPAHCSNHNFCYPAQAFDFITRWLPATSSSSVLHAENTRANIFFWGCYSVLPEGFVDPAHVHFLEPPSIFPSHQPLGPCLRLPQVPLPWAAHSGKCPAEQTRRGHSPRQIHAVSCIRGSHSLQTYTKKIPFALLLL